MTQKWRKTVKKNKDSNNQKKQIKAKNISPAKAQSISAQTSHENTETEDIDKILVESETYELEDISIPVDLTSTSANTRQATELSLQPESVQIDETGKSKKRLHIKPFPVIFILIIITLAAATTAILIRTNYIEKSSVPLTLKGEKIQNPEFSFMYHYILRQNGIDIYKPGIKDILSAPGENNFPTQRDYFLDVTAKTIQIRCILYDDAIEKGYHISDIDREMTETYIKWIDNRAKELGVERDTFIKAYFGVNVTETLIREILTKQYFTENYGNGAKLKELQANEEQAENAYQEARNQYDEISYRILRIVFEQSSQNFVDTANKNAQEIINKIGGDHTKFEEVAAGYFSGEVKERLLEKDSTLFSNMRFPSVENDIWRNWLFDAQRTSGECVIFNDSQGFPIIICFVDRQRQLEPLREANVIYINKENIEMGIPGFSEAEITAFSQSVFEGMNNQEAIINLATTHSDAVIDGKMEFIYNDMIHPKEFEEPVDEWIFNKIRTPGDKTILTMDTKQALIYYGGSSANPEWFDMVNSFIRRENYTTFLESKAVEYPYTLHESALQHITDVPEVIAQQP